MNDVTFSRALSSVMLDNKYDRFVKNKRTGKLNTKSLYKIEMSSKLFQKREARKNKHYAVSLVVDTSGSMGGQKIKVAAESAQKLSNHLAKIGIPHNVVTFGISAHEIKRFNAKEDKEIERKVLGKCSYGGAEYQEDIYAFWDTRVKIPHAKNPGEEITKFWKITEGNDARGKFLATSEYQDAKKAGALIMQHSPGYNTDAEALKFAREKILKETGKKLIIHLSDGQPAPFGWGCESPLNPGFTQRDFDLKHEVKMTIQAGIELYSIGILSDDVNKFYPPKRTGSISDIEQLYPHIIMLIKKNLRRG